MQVFINEKCDRCGKTTQKPVTVEQMNEALKQQERQKAAMEIFAETLKDKLSPTDGPEIVVCLKMNGAYQVQAFDNLCDKPEDAKKKRGCKSRIRTLVNDIFMPSSDGVKKPRKPRTPKNNKEPKKDK